MKYLIYIFLFGVASVLTAPGIVGMFGMGKIGNEIKVFEKECARNGQCTPLCSNNGQCVVITEFSMKNYWFFTKIIAEAAPYRSSTKQSNPPISFDLKSTLYHGPILFSDRQLRLGLYAHQGQLTVKSKAAEEISYKINFIDVTNFFRKNEGRLSSAAQQIKFKEIALLDDGNKFEELRLGAMTGRYQMLTHEALVTATIKLSPLEIFNDQQKLISSVDSINVEINSQGKSPYQTKQSRVTINGMRTQTRGLQVTLERLQINTDFKVTKKLLASELGLTLSGFHMTPSLAPFTNASLMLSTKNLNTQALHAIEKKSRQFSNNKPEQEDILKFFQLLAKVISGTEIKNTLEVGSEDNKKEFIDAALLVSFGDLNNITISPENINTLMNRVDAELNLSVASQLLTHPGISPVINNLVSQNYVKIKGAQSVIQAQFNQGELKMFGTPIPLETLLNQAMTQPINSRKSNKDITNQEYRSKQ